MKFSLKNRPIVYDNSTTRAYEKPYVDWFEGFEKELRERIHNLEIVSGPTDKWGQSRLLLFKEILGE